MNLAAIAIASALGVIVASSILMFMYRSALDAVREELKRFEYDYEAEKAHRMSLENQAGVLYETLKNSREKESMALQEVLNLETRVAFEQDRVKQALEERHKAVDAAARQFGLNQDGLRSMTVLTFEPNSGRCIKGTYRAKSVKVSDSFLFLMDGTKEVALFQRSTVISVDVKDVAEESSPKFGVAEPVGAI